MIDFFLTYQGQLVLNWAVLGVAALGFRWTFLAGQFSMAHATLMGVGAYASAKVAIDWGWDAIPAMLAGAVVTLLASFLVSLLSLRLEDLFLSIGSLAVGLGVISLIDHTDALGGPSGLTPPIIVEPWLILVSLAVIVIASLWLDRTRYGLSARAVADDRLVAASSGLNVRLVRILAWVLGGIIVGFAGSLFSLSLGSIAPHDFGFSYLTLILIAVLAGGAGTAIGPLLGSAFVVLLPEAARVFSLDRGLIYGPMLILLVLLRPNGFLPSWPGSMRRPRQRLKSRKGAGTQLLGTSLAPSDATMAMAADGDASPVLSVQHVSITFGGIRALDDVSFDVRRGAVHALIGPNGAGKTTLVNIITGALKPEAGHVFFRGRDVSSLSGHKRSRLGLSRTFQAPRLLPTLNLRQNVSIGQWVKRVGDRSRAIDVDELLELLELTDLAGRKVNSLNLAEQRRVEIARALATNPELLLLDEPTAGMNHVEALELVELIVKCCRLWGITVLLIEHNMNIVMTYSEDIVVVSFGKWIAEGTPEEIRKHPEVVSAYLGSSA